MKQMNVGVLGAQLNPSDGIEFDGRILDDESVEFHFSCVAWLDEHGRNFDLTDEIADFNAVMNACDQDSELGIRLYNAFKASVYNMILGINTQTWTGDHITIVTVDEDGTKLEVKLSEEYEA